MVLLQGLVQGADDGGVGVDGLLAAPEDADAPGLERQAGGVRGHVGPGLIDDGDDAQGDGDFADHQPIGQGVAAQVPAHGVLELGHGPDAGGHVCDAPDGQTQAVLHDGGDVALGGFQVQCIGG